MTLDTYLSSVTPAEHILRIAELVIDPYPDIASILGSLFMATVKSSRSYPHCESLLENDHKFQEIQQTGNVMSDSERTLLYSLFSQEEVRKVVAEAEAKAKATKPPVRVC
jgi:hypothetical protein